MILAFYTFLTVVGTGFLIDALVNDDDDDTASQEAAAQEEETVIADQQPNGLDLVGKVGDDTLTGGEGPDVITDDLGADEIDGLGGNDEVTSGEDADTVFGGEGDDKILGGAGEDLLLGEDGDDKLRGNQDSDIILGGEGSDTLLGDDGNDLLLAAEITDEQALKENTDGLDITNSTIYNNFTTFEEPDAGADTVDGGRGDDTIVLGAEDTAKGGPGFDDFLVGDWIADGNGPAIVTDFNPLEDVVAYYHNEVEQPNPMLTVETDADGNALLFADGTLISIIENSGAFFTPSLVTLVAYTPPSAVVS
ncbi:MAG: calcium-binding protein [Pseudomonadota bacterium]